MYFDINLKRYHPINDGIYLLMKKASRYKYMSYSLLNTIILLLSGEVFYLWPSNFTIGGDKMMFLNDITISSEGLIYMTDSSTKWNRRHNRYAIMEAELSGRYILIALLWST